MNCTLRDSTILKEKDTHNPRAVGMNIRNNVGMNFGQRRISVGSLIDILYGACAPRPEIQLAWIEYPPIIIIIIIIF